MSVHLNKYWIDTDGILCSMSRPSKSLDSPAIVYVADDVDALLRQLEEEVARLKAKTAERRENCIAYYEEQLTDLRTQLAAMTQKKEVGT